MSPVKALLTTDEAVELLAAAGYEVSRETLRRWARQGRMQVVRKGFHIGRGSPILFRRQDIEALLQPTTVGGAA
jgi:excisionase family DNA binding protein